VKILVLESDETRLELFKQKLNGHVVFYAKTALEALKILGEENIFDQIFLDQKYNGGEVAQWIRKHENKRPYRIVIHGFSVPGAQEILNFLPEASFIPGVWLLDRMEF